VTAAVGGGSADRIISSVTYTLAAGVEIEAMYTNNSAWTTSVNFTGNTLNQVIYGNAADNVLGGGGGADTLRGLAGNDSCYIDSADDIVIEGANGGTADRIISSSSFVLADSAQIEEIYTSNSTWRTAINFTGNAFNQIIYGNAGVNVINGRGGNATLRGHGGADFFVFDTTLGASNVDRLVDFTSTDTIRLENAIFTALAGVGTLNASQFASNTTGVATNSSQRIIYEADTGNLYYDHNGNAAGGSVLFAHLNPGLALTNSDFLSSRQARPSGSYRPAIGRAIFLC
jgi:serralysin